MKVLILGKTSEIIESCIEKSGAIIYCRCNYKLSLENIKLQRYDFIVSYGYRHIIPPDICKYMHRRIINLHISYLPWNRGADPNIWSWLENTPKGVTIHYIDEGVDTGDIIIQEKVYCLNQDEETLATTYQHLEHRIEKLFERWWGRISTNNIHPREQCGPHNYTHKVRDKEQHEHLWASQGWSTPVKQLIGKGI